MRCPNCGFENWDRTEACIKCNQPFGVYEEKIGTCPPRAGRRKVFRKPIHSLRAKSERRRIREPLGEGRIFPWKAFLGLILSIIPGLGHFLYVRIRRGLIFFSLYILSLLGYILYLGLGFGTFSACVLISVVGAAMMDILRLEGISLKGRESFFTSVAITVFVVSVYAYFRSRIDTFVHPIRLTTNYMAPTIQRGDVLLVNRRAYIREEPRRGALVQFVPGALSSTYVYGDEGVIGRIIGLPREIVSYKEGGFFINGEPLKEELYSFISLRDMGDMEIGLSEDEYYILFAYVLYGGRAEGSRGSIRREAIIGRVFMLYQPRSRRQRF